MRSLCGLKGKKREGTVTHSHDILASFHSGLRCYAKFHRNRRVTRRKGRCVEPETVNGDQGSFINI